MAVNYDQATQNARLDATLLRIDNNAAAATLEICTAAYAAVLVSITLNDPSFTRSGTTPNTILGMNGLPKSGTATGTGTAAAARIKEGGGAVTIINNLTVGLSSADIVLSSLSITIGQTVSISAGQIVHAS